MSSAASSRKEPATGKPKKRTRPVSACDNCRSKKVKCILRPDVPVCQGCDASGKACVFRIDDLSPTLRSERFAEFGPPGENARQIASRRKRAKMAMQGDAQAASNNTKDGKEKEYDRFSSGLSHSPNSAYAAIDGRGRREDPYAHQRYDNDRPSSRGAYGTFSTSTPSYGMSGSSSLHAKLSPELVSSAPRNLFNPVYAPQIAWQHPHGPRSPLNASLGNDRYHDSHHVPARPPMKEHQLSQGELPPFRSAFSSGPGRPIDTPEPLWGHPPVYAASVSARGRGASGSSYHPSESSATNRYLARTPSADSPEEMPFSRHKRQSASGSSSGVVLPPPGPSPHAPPSPLRGRQRVPMVDGSRSSSSGSSSNAGANNSVFSRVETNKHSEDGRMEHATSRQGARSDDGSSVTSNRSKVEVKRIALPFFRWFGATANTPGIRRIKVGVYHESEDGSDDEGEVEANITALSTSEGVGQESKTIATDLLQLQKKQQQPPQQTTSALSSPVAVMSDRHTPSQGPAESESTPSARARNLFEPDLPRYPRREILLHLVRLFLKYFKAHCFPWLDNAELLSGAETGELPAILANSICACAAPFSNHVELQRFKKGGSPFADMAKVLIVPMLSWPSVEVIEALVIISYSEFAAGADAGLWMYCGMALRMATDLGLQHEVTLSSMATQKQRDRARLLFWAIVSLDRITCFGTGRPVTMRDDAIDCHLPPLKDPASDSFLFGHIVRALLKRGRIGELLNRRTDDLSMEERGQKLRSMWLELSDYCENLPPELRFGVNTFRHFAAAEQGAAFVYLHVLLQSTMSLLNRPSLLRRFNKEFAMSAPTKLAGIANHASGTIVSILRFAQDAMQETNNSAAPKDKDEHPLVNACIDCNPYLDQLVLPAGRAFLTEREAARETLFRIENVSSQPQSGSRSQPSNSMNGSSLEIHQQRKVYAQSNLMACQMILDRLAAWWDGANWPARALRQETDGASGNDIEPDGTDEDAQPAAIRDVEMILKWVGGRMKSMKAGSLSRIASRRGSMAPLEEQDGNVNTLQELSTLLGSHYVNGNATSAMDQPAGLGFSGSLDATTEVDIQAFINAWANEPIFTDNALSGIALAPPPQQHQSQHEWNNAVPFAPEPTLPPPTPLDRSLLYQPPTAMPDMPLQVPYMEGLDLNAMQFEEFFFKSDANGSQVNLPAAPLLDGSDDQRMLGTAAIQTPGASYGQQSLPTVISPQQHNNYDQRNF